MLGGPLGALGETADKIGFVGFYWIHILLVLGLLIYIPLSKHFHVFVSPVNVYLKSTGRRASCRRSRTSRRPSTSASARSSSSPGRTSSTATPAPSAALHNACPANLTDKPLDPKKIIVDLRLATHAQAGMQMAARHETRTITAATPLIGEEG